MAKSFTKLTRPRIRKAVPGDQINEHGITFFRQPDGDGRYTVNIMVDGQRIHRVVGRESEGTTRKQVEDYIEKIRTEARDRRLNLPKGRKLTLRFAKAADEYMSRLKEDGGKDLRSKHQRFKHHLKPFFADRPLEKISTFDIDRYKKKRLTEGAAPGSVNRELAALSHLFTKAIEWKWLDDRPAKIGRLKEGTGRIVFLTTDQIKRFVDVAMADQCEALYRFVVIGLGTSMRKSEILSIRLRDIDLDRRIIYIPKAKGGAREQPITRHLASFLRQYVAAASPSQTWLFPAKRSATGHRVSIEKPWRRAVKAAGLDVKQVVRHTLRHTAISHLVQAGVDLPTVKRISGHKDISMVLKYSHQDDEHIIAAMDKLEDRYKKVK
jgi:integrase